ncbi:hypothetical protein HID58_025753 [Brassica napus]|uniref:Uncharacterized protein n=1 Tax=Brassica napus TaxID=3708 RepID=A0ABQ8CM21_BRANA|nr:hypothetical protein HID58_025753 [Brassica napus]
MTLPHLAQVLERYSAAMFLRNNETTRAQVLQQPNYSGFGVPAVFFRGQRTRTCDGTGAQLFQWFKRRGFRT